MFTWSSGIAGASPTLSFTPSPLATSRISTRSDLTVADAARILSGARSRSVSKRIVFDFDDPNRIYMAGQDCVLVCVGVR